MLSEHLPYPLNPRHQRVHLFLRVVQPERGAHRAFDAEARHERLGAVMPRAHGDAQAVEQGAEVEVVDVAHEEGDDAALLLGFAEDAHTGDFLQAAGGILGQFVLVGGDGVHAEGGDVVQCAGQSGGADIVWRAGLELEGQLVEGGLLERDVLNHLAAPLVGGQFVQPVFLAVEHAHAGGAVDLVPGEDVEVGIQFAYVDGHVGDALRAVHQHGDAVGMGSGNHLLDGVDGAQHVADVGDADELGLWGEEPFVFIQQQLAAVVHGDDAKHDAALGGLQLPGDDVAVVLHGGDDDLVARLHLRLAEGGRQEVDALRGASGEDDFAGRAGVDKPAHGLAAGFVQLCGLLGEEMHATVYVGVGVVVFVGDGFDHRAGFLRGGAVVQVDQRLAVDGAAEDGEVGAYLVDVVHKYIPPSFDCGGQRYSLLGNDVLPGLVFPA